MFLEIDTLESVYKGMCECSLFVCAKRQKEDSMNARTFYSVQWSTECFQIMQIDFFFFFGLYYFVDIQPYTHFFCVWVQWSDCQAEVFL